MLTAFQIDALARVAQTLRPNWRLDSLKTILHELNDLAPHRTYQQTAHAIVAISIDDNTRTPKRLHLDGEWWNTTPKPRDQYHQATLTPPAWQPPQPTRPDNPDAIAAAKARLRAALNPKATPAETPPPARPVDAGSARAPGSVEVDPLWQADRVARAAVEYFEAAWPAMRELPRLRVGCPPRRVLEALGMMPGAAPPARWVSLPGDALAGAPLEVSL